MKKTYATYTIRCNTSILNQVYQKLSQKYRNLTPEQHSCILNLAVKETYYICAPYMGKKNTKFSNIIEYAHNITMDTTFSFRQEENIVENLTSFFKTSNKSDTIRCCLATVLLHELDCSAVLDEKEYLFARAGLKKGIVLQNVLSAIEDIQASYAPTTYGEVFTGTANVLLHILPFKKEYVNDKDSDIVNLLKVSQSDESSLVNCLCLPVNEKNFLKQRKILKSSQTSTRSKKENIKKAAAYLYTGSTSYYGKGGSLLKNASRYKVIHKAAIIRKASHRLKSTLITSCDWLYFIKKIVSENAPKDILLYLDPPYIGTEKYYKKSKKGFPHKALKDQLIAFAKQGGSFLLSYRATIKSNSQNKYTNADVQKELDSLYKDTGVFIKFFPASDRKDETQIEVLISNRRFTGSTEYNKNIAALLEEYQK